LNYITDVKVFKKRLFQTTLLDNRDIGVLAPHGNTYKTLPKAITVRCAPFEKQNYLPHRNIKGSPVVETPGNAFGLPEWGTFTYSSKGEAADNPLRYFDDAQEPSSEPQKAAVQQDTYAERVSNIIKHIKEWANKVPTMEPEPALDFFVQAKPMDDAPSAPAISECSFLCFTMITQLTFTSEAQTPLWDTARNQDTKTMSNLERAALASKVAVARRYQTNATNPPDMAPSKSTIPHQTNTLQPPPAAPLKLTIPLPPTSNTDSSQLDQISALEMFLNSPISEKSYSAPTSTTDLIDLSDPVPPSTPNPRPESLQPTNEVSTRRFHNTMYQKAPRPNSSRNAKPQQFKAQLLLPSPPRTRQPKPQDTPKLIDPLPSFVKEMNINFQGLINKNLRAFRGRITVRVEFGRILIQKVRLAAEKESRNELLQECDKVLSLLGSLPYTGHIQSETHFSNKLTTVTEEIKYLIDMKNSDGSRLWDQLQHWEVKYEFLYHAKNAQYWAPFTIEMDAETFDTVLMEPRDFGSVYAHGINRAHDFRIAAFGGESTEAIEAKYGKLVRDLKDSLYIPKNSKEPRLTFELKEALVQQFSLDGIRVHRVNKYARRAAGAEGGSPASAAARATRDSSYLKIDEVLELYLRNRIAPNKVVVFDAYPHATEGKKPSDFQGTVPYWFEVSIHSTKVDEVLAQNEKLGLGDEAAWLPEHFVDAAQALYLPACEMLKQMDGVGYHNDNGKDIQEVLGSMISDISSRHSKSTKTVFW
jgi:hypothetical protein